MEGILSVPAMRILYVTQWFDPEPMIKGVNFVKALIERGHEVEVVTGFPNYPIGKLYPGYRIALHKSDTVDGVAINRVALYPSHDRSSVGRILNYASFFVSAAYFAAFRAKRFDVIYAYPPITVGLAAAFAGWVRRRPFVLDIQDLWPDSVTSSGMPGVKRIEWAVKLLCNIAYRRATKIIAQSKGIAARLIERGVAPEKVAVIYNWADEAAAAPAGLCDLTRYGLTGRFNIVFGGNLGQAQGLEALVRAAHIAGAEVPHLQLLLVGDGVEAGRLRALVDELNIRNVRIEPSVPRNKIGDIFAAADILALHLRNDPLFEITIPQKTQFYLAMGKPVLVGVKGEAAKFVIDEGAGLAVEPANVTQIAAAMVRLARMPSEELDEMGRRGREAYKRYFSFSAAVAATERVLESAADRKAQ
jgi:colanic acid biosynthesis glycosyl transferase WcaI